MKCEAFLFLFLKKPRAKLEERRTYLLIKIVAFMSPFLVPLNPENGEILSLENCHQYFKKYQHYRFS